MILAVTVGSLFPRGRLEGSWLRRDCVLQPCLHPGIAIQCEWEVVSILFPSNSEVKKQLELIFKDIKTPRHNSHTEPRSRNQHGKGNHLLIGTPQLGSQVSKQYHIMISHWTIFVSAAGVTLINMLFHPMVIHAFTHSINIHKISYAGSLPAFCLQGSYMLA